MKNKYSAYLLLGATGAGKTPLGQYFESMSNNGNRYVHFDFGENLRSVAAGCYFPDVLSAQDVNFVKDVLSDGRLLEDEQFYIAQSILLSFLAKKSVKENDVIIFNGLPRHQGQAEKLTDVIDFKKVLYLKATPEVILHRISKNTGGDRSGRIDDEVESIQAKLEIFESRTMKLLDFYRRRQAEILTFDISSETRADEIIQQTNLI